MVILAETTKGVNSQAGERSNWLRVNKNSPCPVCGKPDWCLVSLDGSAAICARLQSDKEAGQAGWLHKLSESLEPVSLPKPLRHEQEASKASVEILDKVYSALLAELSLSDAHHDNLLVRGMSEAQIIAGGYKSLPRSGRPALVQKLAARVNSGELPPLAGVPGFYMTTGELRYATLAGAVGMLVPVRDSQGRIAGLQVRLDSVTGGKYRWVSSPGRFGGCSSGSPIHVAGALTGGPEFAVVTEGPLKADIAASRLGCPVLGVAGVSNYAGITQILKSLGVKEVVLAYDMDKVSNIMVRHHAKVLGRLLEVAGLKVYEASWPVEHKGIDDFLVSLPLRQAEVFENNPSDKDGVGDTLPSSLSLQSGEGNVGDSDSDNGGVSTFHKQTSVLHYKTKDARRQVLGSGEYYVQHIAKLTLLASTLAKEGLKLRALGVKRPVERLSSRERVYRQHYDMLNGKGWVAWREYLESRGQLWSLDCLQYGHSWECEAGEHIFEPSLCGDWHYCVVCGFRYEQIQAKAAMVKLMAVAKALPGVELLRLVFTLPQELWSRIGWSNFGLLTRLAGESLAEYYGGQPGGEFNCQYWHTKTPLPDKHGFYPHLHGAVLNVIRDPDGEYKVVPAYIDELKLKTIWARRLGKQFKLEFRVNESTGRPQLKLKRGWSNINLRLSGYVPLNDELYTYSRGQRKGQKARFTNAQYLKARLRYDFRMPQADIAEYAQEAGLERFSEPQKLVIDSFLGLTRGGERIGLPKNFRRERWFGWLGDGVVKRRLAELNITILSAQERKRAAKAEAQEPVVCPEHHTLCSITRGAFGEFIKVSRWDLVPGDILLSANYRHDKRWWCITQAIYERWHKPRESDGISRDSSAALSPGHCLNNGTFSCHIGKTYAGQTGYKGELCRGCSFWVVEDIKF